ncbi:putative nuclease HARBI1 [Saccostrea echinata]|uniref:putative nuclease HARBI1 n=1 Tax=Saccostrea echinata TaxID=191078 RepID=UPI002A80FD49|nr:putative nuclease HARBI1 [Saccostrea echinata]
MAARRIIMQNIRQERIPRRLQDRSNPLESLTEEEIFMRYRFKSVTIFFICSLIENQLEHPTKRSSALPPLLQVLLALRFFATGAFYQLIGDSLAISKSTTGRAVREVTSLLCSLARQFIRFPSIPETAEIRTKFYSLAGFPNMVCCVDGTLIRIRCPAQNEAEYVCRKGYYALNVQMACDASFRFVNCVAKWPGSVHDSRVFRESSLARLFETGARNGIILGDSGYALKRYLIVPYLTPSNRAQERFNTSLCRTRVVIEQAFGILKRRFPCLQTGLRVEPDKACAIVACTVLHNLGIERHDIVDPIPAVQGQVIDEVALPAVGGQHEGKRVRDHIANVFFGH